MKWDVVKNKSSVEQKDQTIFFNYTGLDNIDRTTEIIFPENITVYNNTAKLSLALPPQEQQQISYSFFF